MCRINIGVSAKDYQSLENHIQLYTIEENDFIPFFEKLISLKKDDMISSFNGDKMFYVVLPNIYDIKNKNKRIKKFFSDESTTFICEFDEDFKNLIVKNWDGSIKKIFKI